MQNESVFLKASVPFWLLLMLVLLQSECVNIVLIFILF